MSKKIRISEEQLKRLVVNKKTINEHEGEEKHYMFFNSLEEIKRKSELLLNKIDHDMMDKLLDEHDWAAAHITTADNNLSQVFDFFMNKAKGDHVDDEEENSHDMGMDREDEKDEDDDKEKNEEDMMNKNIKSDDDDKDDEEDKEDEEKDEDKEDKEEMNESIQKIKANFKRFL
jgi:hypothetical protein